MGKRTMKDGKKCGEWIEDGKTRTYPPHRPRRRELAPIPHASPISPDPPLDYTTLFCTVRCGAPYKLRIF